MAQELAEVGVRGIAITDVHQELGDKSACELSEQTGVDVRFYKVDVRDGGAIQQAVQDINDHYGEINVPVNAAGIVDSRKTSSWSSIVNIKAETYDIEKFCRLLDINYHQGESNVPSRLLALLTQRSRLWSVGTWSMDANSSTSDSAMSYGQEQTCHNTPKATIYHLGTESQIHEEDSIHNNYHDCHVP